MRTTFKKLLPRRLASLRSNFIALKDWKDRGFTDNSPQFIKESVLRKHGISNAQWVETGTYLGTTTSFLSKLSPKVYSIEPSLELFNSACQLFKGTNVTLFNDVSENVLDKLMPTLSGEINFWLDGHYSAGVTFQGNTDCPITYELSCIEENLANFSSVTILIDDVRCFLPENNYKDYPSIEYLVDWARRNKMTWRIEHDIFIIKKN